MTSKNDDDVNNNNKLRTKAANDALAEFHLQVYSRARELQAMRTGLMSNETAIRLATTEHFMAGVTAINNAIAHMRLFGGETKDEQVRSMIDYGIAASSTKEARSIMEGMLEKLGASDSEGRGNVIEFDNKLHVQKEPAREAKSKDEECCAP